ncbi:hemoglobin/transferrin/lactoferrin receptor protein [Cricetibacter osteomyelitidis]|uniref:Hemoglobin/transferrin/lactoferrin receptor protein n=1 Tax=Cricetibacter osteomyelitidis TaxID=1521931 RepID=A0A4R2TF37_9PAST|nr:TonB-dependent hemoglobin/transferrin/lactoferrin family receptor [Cricetibacter osteomyelitidis]TCP95788.1 hemoglobin/transferrin/lactoferrin receptor protein [Cricetibacter osteomyelitidis]
MNRKINKHKLPRLSMIAVALLSYSTLGDAKETDQLETINVLGNTNNNGNIQEQVKEQRVGTTVKSAKTLSKQQVQDNRDLVRYETGVTVVEAGRMGSSGYAIRGVDENRVAITVDGLHQAETLSSQGFKELFEGYGNFNNTRNSTEIETLKQVSISKGANSIKTGSGALGGAVIFETKDARDYLLEKDYHLGYKTGYATADNQWMNSLTAAGRYKWFDILFVKTKRHGHELENYGYKDFDPTEQGRKRDKTDPYTIDKNSTLIKFSYSPNEKHRFTVASDTYEHKSKGHDFSYTLKRTTTINADEEELRHTNDKTKRSNYSFTYENFSSTPFWDTLKLTYSQQKIKTRARTDEYCDGNEKCNMISNPLGLQVKNGKIVDKDGDQLSIKNSDTLIKNGAEVNGVFHIRRLNQYWFDCSIFNCNGTINAYKSERDFSWTYTYTPKEFSFDTPVTDSKGNKFAKVKDASYSDRFISPNNSGYLERSYRERDLNTNTKQINLDLTKQLDLFTTEHLLQYGGSYNTVKKEMVNRAGYYAYLPQWWADRFLGTDSSGKPYASCAEAYADIYGQGYTNAYTCPRNEPETSFLIPVKTKSGALYFADDFKINNYLSFNVGYRYDRVKYKPEYIAGVSPKLPDDMVTMFVPYTPPYKSTPKPNYSDYSGNPSGYQDALAKWKEAEAAGAKANEAARKANVQENINYFTRNKKYRAHSYALEMALDPTEHLKLQFKYSKGFRAPTSDELYFTFKHPDFSILPNVNLKPERAKTQEAALTFYGNAGFITTSIFKTKYDNFIDLVYIGSKNETNQYGGQARTINYQLYQNINLQDAKVTGFEMNSKIYFGQLINALEGFNASYKFTYQRGRSRKNVPMNAIQPKTSVFSLGYQHPEDKFGADLYITHVGSKKAKDTYNMYYREEGKTDSSIKWRSGTYTLVDFIAYFKPLKNLTLQAGVYNMMNRKYITWDSVRSIRPFGTSNLIDQKTGEGINRFYSAGRNFKLNAELTF